MARWTQGDMAPDLACAGPAATLAARHGLGRPSASSRRIFRAVWREPAVATAMDIVGK